MRKTEKRDVEVGYCDYCGEEAERLEKCAVCGREMCNKDGGAAHSAFSVELFRFGDGQRLSGFGSKVCRDCAEKKFDGTIRELFDGMIAEDPVPLVQ